MRTCYEREEISISYAKDGGSAEAGRIIRSELELGVLTDPWDNAGIYLRNVGSFYERSVHSCVVRDAYRTLDGMKAGTAGGEGGGRDWRWRDGGTGLRLRLRSGELGGSLVVRTANQHTRVTSPNQRHTSHITGPAIRHACSLARSPVHLHGLLPSSLFSFRLLNIRRITKRVHRVQQSLLIILFKTRLRTRRTRATRRCAIAFAS